MNIREEWTSFRRNRSKKGVVNKLTLEKVAKIMGVSVSMLSRYEHDQRNLTPENEQKLLQIMKEAGENE